MPINGPTDKPGDWTPLIAALAYMANAIAAAEARKAEPDIELCFHLRSQLIGLRDHLLRDDQSLDAAEFRATIDALDIAIERDGSGRSAKD